MQNNVRYGTSLVSKSLAFKPQFFVSRLFSARKKIENVLCNEILVSFQLKNTGKYAGDEVAQIYVQLPSRNEIMPIKELKGFRRITLKKGEEQEITIKLRKDLLRYWDETQGKFLHPSGTYTIMVGASSADIRLQQSLTIDMNQ